ncbi:hypothetical protein RSPO_c00937 [Ralstonia solanacearum Po82]|uniref:Uncharacterized protein n=1 Tax=Ralstonia solanacearum (strain Po82) TaxID=1031711 RepID=F6FZ05_RALS8|nr:hypothetical protein RSPO_c00937 [Ralstonia solanacearum Po82]
MAAAAPAASPATVASAPIHLPLPCAVVPPTALTRPFCP